MYFEMSVIGKKFWKIKKIHFFLVYLVDQLEVLNLEGSGVD